MSSLKNGKTTQTIFNLPIKKQLLKTTEGFLMKKHFKIKGTLGSSGKMFAWKDPAYDDSPAPQSGRGGHLFNLITQNLIILLECSG